MHIFGLDLQDEDLTKNWKHWLNNKLLCMRWVTGVSICPTMAVYIAKGSPGELSGTGELVSSNFQMYFPISRALSKRWICSSVDWRGQLCSVSSVPCIGGTFLSHTTVLRFWSNSAKHLKTWVRLEHVCNPAEEHRDCCHAFSALLNQGWRGDLLNAVALLVFVNRVWLVFEGKIVQSAICCVSVSINSLIVKIPKPKSTFWFLFGSCISSSKPQILHLLLPFPSTILTMKELH